MPVRKAKARKTESRSGDTKAASIRAPFENSYAVPDTRLFAGEYPGALEEKDARRKLARLLDAGVTVFIDLTSPEDGLQPYEPLLRSFAGGRSVDRHQFPIPDVGITGTDRIARILDAIDSALRTRQGVYVHCWGGVGRTGMIVGCWLVRHGRTGEEALALVDQLFHSMPDEKTRRHTSGSPETPKQRSVVLGWADAERALLQILATDDADARAVDGDASTVGEASGSTWSHDAETGLLRSDEGVLDIGPLLMPIISDQPSARAIDQAKGCLLGGAVGDALGAPIEFMKWPEIQQRFGKEGIQEFAPAYGRIGAITDDTQMTLWTAEGVLRGIHRATQRGIGGPMSVLPMSYLRWLFTQDGKLPEDLEYRQYVLGDDETPSGWLLGVKALHARRAPGNTCLAALRSMRSTRETEASNDSKGCGTVMRVAPIALIPDCNPETAFELACEASRITHGHVTGALAAGALVLILSQLRDGIPLYQAASAAIQRVSEERGHEETTAALREALRQGRSFHTIWPKSTEKLGGGWTAESALAIGVYAGLVSRGEFDRGVRIAVNHSGDSDSTGSIAGQILGLQLGVKGIPPRWLEQLELRTEIEAVAEDLAIGVRTSGEWWVKYPGF